MKLKREKQKEKSVKKTTQAINNSDGESRPSSTSSAVFNCNACGPQSDQKIRQHLMRYQNYGLISEFEIKQEPCHNDEVAQAEYSLSGNGQPMEAINYQNWDTQFSAQQQWQQFQMKEKNIYPTTAPQMYSEYVETQLPNNMQCLDLDENFEFDAPVYQMLGDFIANGNSAKF